MKVIGFLNPLPKNKKEGDARIQAFCSAYGLDLVGVVDSRASLQKAWDDGEFEGIVALSLNEDLQWLIEGKKKIFLLNSPPVPNILGSSNQARADKASRGGYAYGAPPYGYFASGGKLVEHPEEQQAIERILDLRAAGWTYQSIADYLNDTCFKPRRGETWHVSAIQRILKRELTKAQKAN